MIPLDILSDPICPWCYIGKARLETALAARPDHPFTIQWHPFQLNPGMPREGMDRRAYLEGKFGGKDGAVKAYLPVQEAADAAGLEIRLDAIRTVPNTLDAHRLIHWAGHERVQGSVVDGLFRAYFVEGRNIGDAGVLADIAGAAGMDRAAVARLLAGETDLAGIEERDAKAREMGVGAVPTFIIIGEHVVQGAQEPAFWEKVIDDIEKQLAEAGVEK